MKTQKIPSFIHRLTTTTVGRNAFVSSGGFFIMNKECLVCKNIFKKTKKESYKQFKEKTTCSHSCSSKRKYSLREHAINWRGGKTKYNGYIYLFKPNYVNANKKGYIAEHRYVFELFIGENMPTGFEIHHKNGIKDDNRVENLQLISKSEHARIHALKNGLGKDKKDYRIRNLKGQFI